MKQKWVLRLLLVILVIQVLLFFWFHTLSVLTGHQDFVTYVLQQQVTDPFRSHLEDDCYSASSYSLMPKEPSSSSQVCHLDDVKKWTPDIQMVMEWDSINVGYSQYVLTVSGWLDTLLVESYTAKPLQVIIMPHSHQDPGWLMSFEAYFYKRTHRTLDHIVEQLSVNRHWKFIWTEIVYLSWWWQETWPEHREKFQRLISNGQLEITSGGWVMTDEGAAHYTSMLDQLIQGHQWLNDNLGTHPNTSWSVDPFGHSPVMAYLLHEAGISDMVISRTHFAVKRHLAYKKSLEFNWHQTWDTKGSKRIFCHMMPFLTYAIKHSCGPDSHVCCKFDFGKENCFRGKQEVKIEPVTTENVASLSWQLWEQLQKKSELYRSNVLLVPHGDDFRYHNVTEWHMQFSNMEKLMNYINNNKEMSMKVEFGTLSDYFKALKTSKAGPVKKKYPSLTGDFFPYSDRSDQYWSGYFTSRPLLKVKARSLQSLLRSVEVWFTLALASHLHSIQSTSPSVILNLLSEIQRARDVSGLIQHHDAITGTSTAEVMADYLEKIHSALLALADVHTTLIQQLLVPTQSTLPKDIHIQLTDEWISPYAAATKPVFHIKEKSPKLLVVSNPLAWRRQDVVHILVDRPDVQVTTFASTISVRYQISPYIELDQELSRAEFMVSIEVDMEPVSIQTYFVKVASSHSRSKMATIRLYNGDLHGQHLRYKDFPFSVTQSLEKEVVVESGHLTAVFHSCDGMLQAVRNRNNVIHKSKVRFVTYRTGTGKHPFRDKSGAYIFLPDGVAKALNYARPRMFVIEGAVFSQIQVYLPDVIQTVTLYNVSGVLSNGVHIDHMVSLTGDSWNNTELALRLETDVTNNDHSFYTDLNGFQLYKRRTHRKLTLQGNFYPMTSMTLIEDQRSRVTVLTTESHGVASLIPGVLDIILDRRLIHDDWRGLGEGITDNVPTPSRFVILFEENNFPEQKVQPSDCYPSPAADRLSHLMDNPVFSFLIHQSPEENWIHDLPPLVNSFPCDLHLVNFRFLKFNQEERTGEAFMILHRTKTDCRYTKYTDLCQDQTSVALRMLKRMKVLSVEEMNLTGVQVKQQLGVDTEIDLQPMELKTYKVVFH